MLTASRWSLLASTVLVCHQRRFAARKHASSGVGRTATAGPPPPAAKDTAKGAAVPATGEECRVSLPPQQRALDALDKHAEALAKQQVANSKSKLLMHKFPSIALEYDEANSVPLAKVMHGSGKKAMWRCACCSHRWEEAVLTRTALRTSCPKCSAGSSRETLATFHGGMLLDEWHSDLNDPFVNPATMRAGVIQNAWWRCTVCGDVWQDTVGRRLKSVWGTGCQRCSVLARVVKWGEARGLAITATAHMRGLPHLLKVVCSKCDTESEVTLAECLQKGCLSCTTRSKGS